MVLSASRERSQPFLQKTPHTNKKPRLSRSVSLTVTLKLKHLTPVMPVVSAVHFYLNCLKIHNNHVHAHPTPLLGLTENGSSMRKLFQYVFGFTWRPAQVFSCSHQCPTMCTRDCEFKYQLLILHFGCYIYSFDCNFTAYSNLKTDYTKNDHNHGKKVR